MPGETQDLEESLKLLMMERCGTPEEKFRPEATLQGDLGLDSLDAVELAMALEDKYNIKVTDADMIPMRTVGDLMALIERLQHTRAEVGKPNDG
jgi:acyl carrier protein